MFAIVVATALSLGCGTDMDCKGDRVCEAGRCVAPTSAWPTHSAYSPSSHDSNVNLHVNALGVLQFGLAPAVEFGTDAFSMLLRVRAYNTGLLPYFLLADGSDDESFNFGIGGGVGLRGWVGSGTMRGFYYGGTLEYGYLDVSDEEDDRAQYITGALVMVGELGYRWVFGSFLLGVGLNAGAAVPIHHEDVPIGSEGCAYSNSCPGSRSVFPFGMLAVDVGVFL